MNVLDVYNPSFGLVLFCFVTVLRRLSLSFRRRRSHLQAKYMDSLQLRSETQIEVREERLFYYTDLCRRAPVSVASLHRTLVQYEAYTE